MANARPSSWTPGTSVGFAKPVKHFVAASLCRKARRTHEFTRWPTDVSCDECLKLLAEASKRLRRARR